MATVAKPPVARHPPKDRRRNVDPKEAILQIGHSTLRLAIVVDRPHNQRKLMITRTLPWRDSSAPFHHEQTQAEFQHALSTLVTEERLNGCAVRILLNSDLCVTRAITGTTERVRREVHELQERSHLYLALGPGEKILASSISPIDARHAHALVTVSTQQTLDAIAKAVRETHLQLKSISSAQVSLAYLAGRLPSDEHNAAIVVPIDEQNMELGVTHSGRLLLDYRPGGPAGVDQLGDILTQHHTRLTRYCQRHHALPETQLTRVYLAGADQDVASAVVQLKSLQGMQVAPLHLEQVDWPWEFRDAPPGTEMAAVLGTALAVSGSDAFASPNLTESFLPNTIPALKPLLLRKLSPLGAVLLLTLGLQAFNWYTASQIHTAQEELAQKKPFVGRAELLRSELIAANQELKHLTTLAEHLPPKPIALWLQNVTRSLPHSMWLQRLQMTAGNQVQMSGASYVDSDIYDFMGYLRHLPGVVDVTLESTEIGQSTQGPMTLFQLKITLNLTGTHEESKEGA